MPRTRTPLLVAVRDPPSVEVVRGELDLDAIAREDADVVAPHLAGDVPEDLVVVVELHAEHRVGEGLHDLSLHLDLVFLGQSGVNFSGPGRTPCPAPARGTCPPRS